MTRSVVAVAAIVAALAGCAPDPPSAVVGVEARGCRPFPERGSGMIVTVDGVAGQLVLTSAHVVAGADTITVRRGDATRPGRIVAFDPDMDLAYLAVEGLGTGRPWTIASTAVDAGAHATAYVVRADRPVAVPVTVARRVTIRTEDVYVEGETRRPGYELRAAIEEGDSGAAVVSGGEVVGVVWARSRLVGDRAYAVDPVGAGARVRAQLRTGDLSDIDLTRCP